MEIVLSAFQELMEKPVTQNGNDIAIIGIGLIGASAAILPSIISLAVKFIAMMAQQR